MLLLSGCWRQSVTPAPALPAADVVVAAEGGDFATVNDAIAAASDGSVILIKPGIYREQVRVVGKRRLTIIGADPATTIIDATGRYAAVEIRTDSNRIANLTLRNADDHGIWVRDGSQVIERCLVVNCGDRGIYLSALAGFAFARIEYCTIVENGSSGIYAARDDERTVVRNCIIANNPRGIVTDNNSGRLVIEYNCLFNTEADFDRVTPGAGNIIANPGFVDSASGDWRLRPDSPCISAGSDGGPVGCFPAVQKRKSLF